MKKKILISLVGFSTIFMGMVVPLQANNRDKQSVEQADHDIIMEGLHKEIKEIQQIKSLKGWEKYQKKRQKFEQWVSEYPNYDPLIKNMCLIAYTSHLLGFWTKVSYASDAKWYESEAQYRVLTAEEQKKLDEAREYSREIDLKGISQDRLIQEFDAIGARLDQIGKSAAKLKKK